MIVDTDIGGDPDDAVALVVAALAVPELRLVVTSDEVGGARARLARYLLDLCGRSEVDVVAGKQVRESAYFTASGLVPDSVEQPGDNVVEMVDLVCNGDGFVRWVGLGPLSNLAETLRCRPSLATRLVVTQMGGAVNYRDPARAEHNVRLDPDAVQAVVATVSSLRLVTSDVTFVRELEVDAKSELYQRFAARRSPPWCPLLRDHFAEWFAKHHPSSIQHDALTLSAALQLPFVSFQQRRIAFDLVGRMSVGDGADVLLSQRADYQAFLQWLSRILSVTDR